MYLSIFLFIFIKLWRNRSSGWTEQCGSDKKRELARSIIAPLYIFLSVELNERKGDISFIMKDPPEFRFTMFLSFCRTQESLFLQL